MTERIRVATRKGLFTVRRSGRSWQIGDPAFAGDPVTTVLDDPRDGTVHAALYLGHFGVKMRRSTDDGRTWAEAAVPAFPEQPEDSPGPPWVLRQIWCMEPGGGPRPGTLWAGTLPGALFRSDDAGQSWNLVRPLWDRPERLEWFGGGYDHPGIHSVAVDPRSDGQRITVAISCGGVWRTLDGGQNWALAATGMRAGYMPPGQQDQPNVQDPHRLVACAAAPEVLWTQHHSGIFRSVDGAQNWTEVTGVKPSSFGFAVAAHPADPATAWFVPAARDELRVPVDARLVVTRTRDGGKSFEVLSEGLPRGPAYDLVYRHGLDIDPSGTLLAMGSTTGSLWISEDAGDTWTNVTQHLPPIYAVRIVPD